MRSVAGEWKLLLVGTGLACENSKMLGFCRVVTGVRYGLAGGLVGSHVGTTRCL